MGGASRNSRHSTDPWASAVVGVRVEYKSKMHEGVLLVYLNVTRMQERARRGTSGKVKPYHIAVPGHLVGGGSHSLFWGMLRYHIIGSFKNLQYRIMQLDS